jgi:hypothetical protein
MVRPWKTGTASQRAANTTTSTAGDIGTTTDTGDLVVGDGVKTWGALDRVARRGELAAAAVSSVGAQIVVHGANAATARPDVTVPVLWFGTVQPTNLSDGRGDIWLYTGDDNAPADNTAPDATTTTKGVVQLSGDLAGTAASPTVPGLTAKAAAARVITAGTGLTGGGDLTADRTINANIGTTAGTIAAGDHTHPQYAAAPLASYLTTSSVAVNNSTTLVDSALILTVSANAVYELTGLIWGDASTTADLKFGWTAPTGSAGFWSSGALANSVTTSSGGIFANQVAWTGTSPAAGIGVGTKVLARLAGLLVVGSTGGALTFRFAQNTAEATDATLGAYSHIALRRIA